MKATPHWKHTATRCAYRDCECTRRKGWTTCPRHYSAGRTLYGLRPGQPRLRDR